MDVPPEAGKLRFSCFGNIRKVVNRDRLLPIGEIVAFWPLLTLTYFRVTTSIEMKNPHNGKSCTHSVVVQY